MRGIKRILVFCTLTTIVPILFLITPLYLRHNFYGNVAYAVTDSDILEITDGISTVFCSEHVLQMNRTFNAFQMAHKPEITSYKKHIRLKKSMTLPDDTLEYWGFYLLEGSSVALSVCSRFEGASILVVKGERNLRTCGMLEHNNEEIVENIFLPEAKQQVKVTFKSDTIESISNNSIVQVDHNDTLNNTTNKFFRNITSKLEENHTDKNATNVHSPINSNTLSNEDNFEEELRKLVWDTKMYMQQHMKSPKEPIVHNARKLRHAKKKQYKKQIKEKEKNMLEERRRTRRDIENGSNIKEKEIFKKRTKRNQDLVKPFLLDQGVKHGGNAVKNLTNGDDDSSVSSFENELFKCYGGSILMSQEFPPSEQCTNVTYLLNGKHMQATHNVIENGYYYYIFYSDNDIVSNDIYALFDIYKPIFHYENITKSCINQTKCSFSINLLSSDRVIVEIPTKDGLEYEIDDISLLLSVCHPRMEVYVIFPIAVLFFILACAFM
ncbi:uncharacterized protein LOC114872238 [Osmia bicornis bicornis]|uniref:uncharacterized protein LOC114872238 n=1 Tax=Osmia bicornis bicornis TaxID=1437191 RepID=UPI0010F68F98|nr:uncharacterized protein LOC114872238 [Osmia bicornis bicornis]XP_029035084.1 uncharacterized protein LOC114872238 [Osmia bicornis bicornis]XP_029035085.1 uncharacterized protein LOC114872238 [Osmia bicornis bicornis]XP_029035086.1 uncharacterized protein LOC114872238 [Osmia bicornis bicornis]XP_029035087.1 uncharacterized protein LOC114872238 [Osmia bicornis bicornis]